MNIRQQTQLRSYLVCAAERGIGRQNPKARIRVVEPIQQVKRPDRGFMLDESQSSDPITARFPRTSREAFGHGAALPLCPRITFLQSHRGGWIGIAVVVATLAAFALAGLKP